MGKIRRSLPRDCLVLQRCRGYFRRLFMKNVLLVVGLSIVFNVPASCQDGWRTTTFLTPGLGKVLKEDRLALSGMAGFQFGIQQGRFITGAGLNVAYLQSRQSRPLLSNVGPASQPS